MKQKRTKNDQDLKQAYQEMLEHVKRYVEAQDDAEMEKAVQEAMKGMKAIGRWSHDELLHIGEYLKRDLEHMLTAVKKKSTPLTVWLQFDWKLAESALWQLLVVVADKTNLGMAQLQYDLVHPKGYVSGEIMGIGQLACKKCKHTINITKITELPSCPKCEHNAFDRL